VPRSSCDDISADETSTDHICVKTLASTRARHERCRRCMIDGHPDLVRQTGAAEPTRTDADNAAFATHAAQSPKACRLLGELAEQPTHAMRAGGSGGDDGMFGEARPRRVTGPLPSVDHQNGWNGGRAVLLVPCRRLCQQVLRQRSPHCCVAAVPIS